MRTTITLDPDVDLMLKDAMRRQDAPFKKVVNDALRAGLRQARPRSAPKYVQPVHDLGPLLVAQTNLNALAAELEDQELIAKLRRGS